MSESRDAEFQARATRAESLDVRAGDNARYGSGDFDGWSRGLIENLKFASVVELACGTGNQLCIYAKRPGMTRLVGVDLSGKALAQAGERLKQLGASARISLLELPLDDAPRAKDLSTETFDLVSCFYGLYYAADPGKVLEGFIDRLTENGSVIVVGPHGKNNATLFDILERHTRLPDLVVYSATTFMNEAVMPVLRRRLNCRIETFVNPVIYPDTDAVMRYWKASTFYDAKVERAVRDDIDAAVRRDGRFVIEKHVMAAIGTKGAQ